MGNYAGNLVRTESSLYGGSTGSDNYLVAQLMQRLSCATVPAVNVYGIYQMGDV
jgi:hypothetical protein